MQRPGAQRAEAEAIAAGAQQRCRVTRGTSQGIEEGDLGITGEARVQRLGWGWGLLGS